MEQSKEWTPVNEVEWFKKCSKCKDVKSLSEFAKDKSRLDGYSYNCKSCKKAYRNANKDKSKAYYQDNKDKKKAYYQDNKYKIRENQTVYNKRKRHTNPMFKLKDNLRKRLSSAIKRKGYSKNTKTADTLGCSWELLKEYLESQFVNGMNWDNYGKWHIDHIKPLASANTEEEIYNLNHYTNLQPLWAEDNLRKSDNIDYKQFRLL